MRLFVAVEIGAEIAAAAATVIDDLRRRALRLAPHAKLTWIPADRLHLTVRFIGHADEEHYHAIAAALEPDLEAQAFDLAVAGTGTFPHSGPPRVIWAGVARELDALREVEREVSRRLDRIGVPPEERAYNPHLTLARIREAAGLRPARLLDGYRDTTLGATRVRTITLFESRLSPKGPTYVRLQKTRLRS